MCCHVVPRVIGEVDNHVEHSATHHFYQESKAYISLLEHRNCEQNSTFFGAHCLPAVRHSIFPQEVSTCLQPYTVRFPKPCNVSLQLTNTLFGLITNTNTITEVPLLHPFSPFPPLDVREVLTCLGCIFRRCGKNMACAQPLNAIDATNATKGLYLSQGPS